MQLEYTQGLWIGRFQAMASPCELLVDGGTRTEALRALQAVRVEALRIEHKYSRYRTDNLIHRLHHSGGVPVRLDRETAGLIAFGAQTWDMSEGRFDLSSGVLREVWHFDGSDHIPSEAQVRMVMQRVGWQRLSWNSPYLTLPAGMQIDLGGIGKEYAVDRCVGRAVALLDRACVVNFGGDLRASAPRRSGSPWQIGVEGPAANRVELLQGAVATSGDARRYLLRDGRRYSHILDARTGWPVPDAPRSVTVAADDCVTAGLLATLASLQGGEAESFLQALDVTHEVNRH